MGRWDRMLCSGAGLLEQMKADVVGGRFRRLEEGRPLKNELLVEEALPSVHLGG